MDPVSHPAAPPIRRSARNVASRARNIELSQMRAAQEKLRIADEAEMLETADILHAFSKPAQPLMQQLLQAVPQLHQPRSNPNRTSANQLAHNEKLTRRMQALAPASPVAPVLPAVPATVSKTSNHDIRYPKSPALADLTESARANNPRADTERNLPLNGVSPLNRWLLFKLSRPLAKDNIKPDLNAKDVSRITKVGLSTIKRMVGNIKGVRFGQDGKHNISRINRALASEAGLTTHTERRAFLQSELQRAETEGQAQG